MTGKINARKQWLFVAVALCRGSHRGSRLVFWRAEVGFRLANQAESAESNLNFTVGPLLTAADNGFEWVSAPAAFTQAAELKGHLYVAGPAGLFEFDGEG